PNMAGGYWARPSLGREECVMERGSGTCGRPLHHPWHAPPPPLRKGGWPLRRRGWAIVSVAHESALRTLSALRGTIGRRKDMDTAGRAPRCFHSQRFHGEIVTDWCPGEDSNLHVVKH